MKMRGKYLLIGVVLLLLVLGSIFVFSSGHLGLVDLSGAEVSSEDGAQEAGPVLLSVRFPLSPLSTDSMYYTIGRAINSVRGNYQRVAGVSHSAGEVERAIYSDYLRVNAVDDRGLQRFRLFGINEFRQATYVVPLIEGATCNKLCKYTLGGQCKGVVASFNNGRWSGGSFNSADSNEQGKLVFQVRGTDNKCNRDYSDGSLSGAAMCFCGS